MTRFRQGTTDHDGDGRMGGSLKETEMTKTKTTKAAAKKTEPLKAGDTPEVNYSDASGTDTTAQEGAAARLDTMTPKNRKGSVGQVETTSGSGDG